MHECYIISSSISTFSLTSKPRQNFSNQQLTPSTCIVLLTQTDVVIYYQKGLRNWNTIRSFYTYLYKLLFHRQAASNRIRPEDIVITGTRETSEGLVVDFYVKSSSGEVVPADTVTNGIEEVWFHSLFHQMLNKCVLIYNTLGGRGYVPICRTSGYVCWECEWQRC